MAELALPSPPNNGVDRAALWHAGGATRPWDEAPATGQPAVFIDQGSALLAGLRHEMNPARLRFMPDALASLRALSTAGFALVVVTAQNNSA